MLSRLISTARQPTSSFGVRRLATIMASPPPRPIRTAACLIIGDEVLGGKTVDTNSNFMAKWCFNKGITLKRIEVIADDEAEIVEAVRRMSERYDFIVTSGGIGPTHDDITYSSIAKAFNLPLVLHAETAERMKRLGKAEADFDWDVESPHREAKLRMARLPLKDDSNAAVLFVRDNLWVPVVVANENVHVLPGVPQLFQTLLEGLDDLITPRVASSESKMHRILISTTRSESSLAGYLRQLAERVASRGALVGSYPKWELGQEHRNTVSLVGRDVEYLESLVKEIEKGIDGQRITIDEDEKMLPS